MSCIMCIRPYCSSENAVLEGKAIIISVGGLPNPPLYTRAGVQFNGDTRYQFMIGLNLLHRNSTGKLS